MGIKLEYIEGQTPIDEDEKEGLRIKTISTRSELDEFEQANIQQGIEWSIKSKFKRDEILSEEFILLVHKKMFNEVWSWAGTKRKTDKNIGVDKHYISIELKNCWMIVIIGWINTFMNQTRLQSGSVIDW
jgi:fido (protein-threonine AMPylation protein)